MTMFARDSYDIQCNLRNPRKHESYIPQIPLDGNQFSMNEHIITVLLSVKVPLSPDFVATVSSLLECQTKLCRILWL